MMAQPAVPDMRWDSPRLREVARDDEPLRLALETVLGISVSGLERMRCSDGRGFVHTLRETAPGQVVQVGENPRYAAIVLLGCRWLPDPVQRRILGGPSAREFFDVLMGRGGRPEDLGDAALIAWAGGELAHPRTEEALERMDALARAEQAGRSKTVEVAWSLSAWSAARSLGSARAEPARAAARRLLESFVPSSDLFAPSTAGPRGRKSLAGLRDHVACFADQVYPIQALARFHHAFGSLELRRVAERCADRICALQGPAGQWWWHYDARTGNVIEPYPVYSVHQDAMGPMCLFDLAASGGPTHTEAIRRSMAWLMAPTETTAALIDPAESVIWRKVARREPARLVRGLRAASTRINPRWRVPSLDRLFPATVIERECRPYHLGWVLATWLGSL